MMAQLKIYVKRPRAQGTYRFTHDKYLQIQSKFLMLATLGQDYAVYRKRLWQTIEREGQRVEDSESDQQICIELTDIETMRDNLLVALNGRVSTKQHKRETELKHRLIKTIGLKDQYDLRVDCPTQPWRDYKGYEKRKIRLHLTIEDLDIHGIDQLAQELHSVIHKYRNRAQGYEMPNPHNVVDRYMRLQKNKLYDKKD